MSLCVDGGDATRSYHPVEVIRSSVSDQGGETMTGLCRLETLLDALAEAMELGLQGAALAIRETSRSQSFQPERLEHTMVPRPADDMASLSAHGSKKIDQALLVIQNAKDASKPVASDQQDLPNLEQIWGGSALERSCCSNGGAARVVQDELLESFMMSKNWLRAGVDDSAEDVQCDFCPPSMGWCRRLQRCMETGRFDLFAAVFVIMNAFVMILQLEYSGQAIGYEYGLKNAMEPVVKNMHMFKVIDGVFACIFVIELMLRMAAQRLHFFMSSWNAFDSLLVSSSVLEVTVDHIPTDLSLLRLFRLLRLLRVLRVVRVLRVFRELRVLVRTVACSMQALFWSSVLLGIVIVMGGVFLGQLTHGMLEDPSTDSETRDFLWQYFGTSGHSIFTVFQWTLTGTWAESGRRLIEDVGGFYSIVVVLHVGFANFALIRIVGAMFLKETLAAATTDSELVVEECTRQQNSLVQQVESLFRDLDVDGDGLVNEEEFYEVVHDRRFRNMLESLEVRPHEVNGLFRLIDDGDGLISCQELITGVVRLRGGAKHVDVVSLLYEMKKLAMQVRDLHGLVGEAPASVIQSRSRVCIAKSPRKEASPPVKAAL